MCKTFHIFKKIILFLAAISIIVASAYYFIHFYKQYINDDVDLENSGDNVAKKEPAKRHYTKLTLPTE